VTLLGTEPARTASDSVSGRATAQYGEGDHLQACMRLSRLGSVCRHSLSRMLTAWQSYGGTSGVLDTLKIAACQVVHAMPRVVPTHLTLVQ